MAELRGVVIVCDEQRRFHKALVTAIHGWTTPEQRTVYLDKQIESYRSQMEGATDEQKKQLEEWIATAERTKDAPFSPSCINVVYVSDDPNKTDPYGGQLERLSSLQHESQVQNMTNPGRFYREID